MEFARSGRRSAGRLGINHCSRGPTPLAWRSASSRLAPAAGGYDASGNLASDGSRSYTWHGRNQLTSVTGPVSGSFAYDGLVQPQRE
jgi:hypothetical protein